VSSGVNNNLTIGMSGSAYTFTDTAERITLAGYAPYWGWSVSSDGHTATGPVYSTTYLIVDLGNGNNTCVVQSIVTPTLITNSGGGSDRVVVTDGGGVQHINAPLTVNNPSGSTSLEVGDNHDTTPHPNVTMNDGSITGLAPQPIFWTPTSSATGGVTSLWVTGGKPATLDGNTFTINNTSNFHDATYLLLRNDTVNVLGTKGKTNLYDDSFWSHTFAHVNVGNAGNMQGITGTLNIEGTHSATGSFTINLDDSADPNRTVTTISTLGANPDDHEHDSDHWGQVVGLAPAHINFEYGNPDPFLSNTDITVQTGTRLFTNVVNVQETEVKTHIVAHGYYTTVNVGKGGRVQGIQGPLSIENPASLYFVNIDNSADPVTRTLTIDNWQADPTWGYVDFGTAPGPLPIYFKYAHTDITLRTGTSNYNAVHVQATGTTTNLVGPLAGMSGYLTVWVPFPGHSVQGINGTLNIEGRSNIHLDDSADQAPNKIVTISTLGTNPDDFEGDSDPWGQVVGLAPAHINFEYADTAIELQTGTSSSTVVNVLQTGAYSTNILSNGPTVINIGSSGGAGSLAGIQGPLNLENEPDFDTVNINDQNDATFRTATIDTVTRPGDSSLGRLSISGLAPITWDYADTDSVTINTGSAGATVTVLGTDTGDRAGPTTLNGSTAGGVNTLVGGNVNTTWHITGTNAGYFTNDNAAPSFTNFRNLTGGTAADAFVFNDGAGVSGIINGGGGGDTLDYSGYATGVSVNVGANTATGTGSFVNIQQFIGGAATNTLTGPNGDTTWNINTPNAGTFTVTGGGTFTFSAFQNLTGGSGADAFDFANGARVDGNIDGGGGSNTFDESAYSTPVTVNLAAATATGVGGTFTNIQNFVGGGGGNTLLGPNADTSWNLNGSNTGTLTGGYSFSAFQNLTGGAGADTFVFADGAAVDGVIDGGGGTNTLDYSAYTSNVIVNLQAGTATGVGGGIANIQNVTGGNGPGGYNLLVGNGGNVLTGGNGRRNLLIAGNNGVSGSTLIGGDDEDILIAGTTDYDTNAAALLDIMSQWTGTGVYADRVNQVTDPGYTYSLNAATVHSNNGVNTLTGKPGGSTALDLYFASLADTIDATGLDTVMAIS
jgi:hypothetical protein